MTLDKYRCLRCSTVYDWKDVYPNTHQRYLDCDIWRCPGCGRQQDSRGEYDHYRRSYEKVTDRQLEQERFLQKGFAIDDNGTVWYRWTL